MTSAGRELLRAVQEELAPRDDENRLAPLIAAGTAPRRVFGVIAAEELHIVPSDWRSFHTLAARSGGLEARRYFGGLAGGEDLALAKLPALAAEAGMDEDDLRAYEPQAGCQAYPAYFAWLALNGDPAEVAVAITANFAAWGRYCAEIAGGMREHYGFSEQACGFFDFFATPQPDDQAVAAVDEGLAAGTLDAVRARRYARLFQSYELTFWNTLAEQS
ncbi:transcriptional regulator [Amycolatopsis antarctica]|uniref:Transcriptional regulator n=1 Tax=Amycolatopsis antarctica TaxID=1854586 RepID=A0A263D3T7_9PSEU|nr:transcriptional regulator [Amycolatopsis antarctica]OZM72287.1 transcriptional regulator [Amycolatopsis antarctica]